MLAEKRMLRERGEMMLAEHRQTLWAHFASIALGAWLVTSPTVFGLFEPAAFNEAVVRVTAERGLASPEWRNWALSWSAIGVGVLIILFGLLSLSRRNNWAQWANTFVGLAAVRADSGGHEIGRLIGPAEWDSLGIVAFVSLGSSNCCHRRAEGGKHHNQTNFRHSMKGETSKRKLTYSFFFGTALIAG